MDVHASPDELPELKEFLGSLQVRFRRPEGQEALQRYTTGLLTELPNKNCDTIAQAVPGTSEQRLQEFLTTMQWDAPDLNCQLVQKMVAEATLGDGVLVLDDTGFPKQGKASVGVARQYSGTLGKVGNCQIAVTCCDTDPQVTWPVAVGLYLPKTWAEDPERRQKARVPPAVSFQTKPEIALRLLDQARLWEVPHGCVVADADDGDNPHFLAGLEARQERYVVGVRVDFRVSLQRKGTSLVQRAGSAAQGTAPLAVADDPLAARHQGMGAQEVCGRAMLARDHRRPAAGRMAAGGTGHPGPAGGAEIRLEQPAGFRRLGGAGRLCPSPLCGRAVS
jgi:SRSO17 transposase